MVRYFSNVAAATFVILGAAFASHAAWADSPFNCDRVCLKNITDLYFKAMAAHDRSMLSLAPELKYTETGHALKLGEGIWRTASGLPTYRLELFDPETGGIGVHAVVPDGKLCTIMSLRLKVMDHRITEVETLLIAQDTKIVGAAPDRLTKPSNYWTRTIRPAEQNSRYELIAAADAYFRAMESNGTLDYIRAPWLPDTNRYENGLQVTNVVMSKDFPAKTVAESFDVGRYKGGSARDRRYPVVDSETGAVMSLVRFGDPMGPLRAPGLPPGSAPPDPSLRVGASFVSEIFAVTQGKIVEIQAFWIPADGQIPTPWPVGTVPVRDH